MDPFLNHDSEKVSPAAKLALVKPVKKNLSLVKLAGEKSAALKPEVSAALKPELGQASSAASDMRIETQNLRYIAGLLKQSASSDQ